jgi:hypothetical protein
MRNFYLLALIVVSTLSSAQNITPEQLNQMTVEAARGFADQLANSGKTKWEYLYQAENSQGKYFSVKYVNSSLSAEDKEHARKKEWCDSCLTVTFVVYHDGENRDLEIPGVKTYKFYEVYGKYLDLFPTWKQVFRPDADLEKTIDDYDSQELISRPKGIKFKFRKEQDIWQIRNWS